jgi:SsrA-binding protein
MGKKQSPERAAATNRKAWHKYQILETFEAGVELKGSEVKSIRAGHISIEEAFARVLNGQLTLLGCTIMPYVNGAYANHEPLRPRRLLMHGREIRRLASKTAEKGLTIVPLKVYFNGKGWAKVELGLARGKTMGDKRQSMRKKEQEREMARAKVARRK